MAVKLNQYNPYNQYMEQEFRENLAHNLKIERAKSRLTQEKLAELAFVSPKHITKIESAKSTPSVYLVHRLAKVLNTTIDNLVNKPNV